MFISKKSDRANTEKVLGSDNNAKHYFFLHALPASFTQLCHFLLGCSLPMAFAFAMILLPMADSSFLVIFDIICCI